MWVGHAVIAARWRVARSSNFAGAGLQSLQSSYPSSLLSPSQSQVPDRGYLLLHYRCIIYNKVTKNKLLMNKQRDASFENLMDGEKRMKVMKRIIAILLKQPSQKMLYRYMLRRGKDAGLVKPQRMSHILQKYPRIVRVYREPGEIDVWVTLAKPILALMEKERTLKEERTQFAVERLRKLLMMTAKRRIRLDRLNYLTEELGLPDDFRKTVIKSNPKFFKLVKPRKELDNKAYPILMVKLVERDPQLAIPAIELRRQSEAVANGLDETEVQKRNYSFPTSLPPGFKIKKGFRSKQQKWQELPYRSPYEDTTDLNPLSEEAFKRAVAVVHEFLHISVEKRTRVNRLAHLREDLKLPQKLGITVLQNPGIFYMSTKSGFQTIFLREAYKKGELIQKDTLHVIKEEFLALLKLGRKSIKKLEDKSAKARNERTRDEEIDEDNLPGETESEVDEDGKEGAEEWSEDDNSLVRVHSNRSFSKGDPSDSEGDDNVSNVEARSEDNPIDCEYQDSDAEKAAVKR